MPVARTGRPPIDAERRRGAPLPVRFTDQERELIEVAAAADGMSLSAWIRARAVTAAKRGNRRRLAPEARQAAARVVVAANEANGKTPDPRIIAIAEQGVRHRK
jgi:uncharacterized protein (DUF1778 family)